MFLILIHVCNVYHNIFWPFNYQVNNDLLSIVIYSQLTAKAKFSRVHSEYYVQTATQFI